MKLTKQELKAFLDSHPSIKLRALSIECGLHENAINQLFNKCNRGLTDKMSDKILAVLPKYGFEL